LAEGGEDDWAEERLSPREHASKKKVKDNKKRRRDESWERETDEPGSVAGDGKEDGGGKGAKCKKGKRRMRDEERLARER
jgi:hypothetical protein